jgi:hypothetical protein
VALPGPPSNYPASNREVAIFLADTLSDTLTEALAGTLWHSLAVVRQI